ncbi:uncharacterized protein LOC131859859 [Cryptomeria japonica]|uniref:uncharacterized protein LOC131859859 n=1 Tax=Cryptomeria japonica TaxID=3369 RepID=UPI0027D9E2FE|nr:uncharacterized protein LOC131859859 [Cryptomeria japonica]
MILLVRVTQWMEEYTMIVARIVAHLVHGAPFPQRIRLLILRRLHSVPVLRR